MLFKKKDNIEDKLLMLNYKRTGVRGIDLYRKENDVYLIRDGVELKHVVGKELNITIGKFKHGLEVIRLNTRNDNNTLTINKEDTYSNRFSYCVGEDKLLMSGNVLVEDENYVVCITDTPFGTKSFVTLVNKKTGKKFMCTEEVEDGTRAKKVDIHSIDFISDSTAGVEPVQLIYDWSSPKEVYVYTYGKLLNVMTGDVHEIGTDSINGFYATENKKIGIVMEWSGFWRNFRTTQLKGFEDLNVEENSQTLMKISYGDTKKEVVTKRRIETSKIYVVCGEYRRVDA